MQKLIFLLGSLTIFVFKLTLMTAVCNSEHGIKECLNSARLQFAKKKVQSDEFPVD